MQGYVRPTAPPQPGRPYSSVQTYWYSCLRWESRKNSPSSPAFQILGMVPGQSHNPGRFSAGMIGSHAAQKLAGSAHHDRAKTPSSTLWAELARGRDHIIWIGNALGVFWRIVGRYARAKTWGGRWLETWRATDFGGRWISCVEGEMALVYCVYICPLLFIICKSHPSSPALLSGISYFVISSCIQTHRTCQSFHLTPFPTCRIQGLPARGSKSTTFIPSNEGWCWLNKAITMVIIRIVEMPPSTLPVWMNISSNLNHMSRWLLGMERPTRKRLLRSTRSRRGRRLGRWIGSFQSRRSVIGVDAWEVERE